MIMMLFPTQDRDLLNPALTNLRSLRCVSYLPLKATDRFETTRWTTSDIQAYIHKGFNLTCPQAAPKLVRIYVDGSFDVFDVGQACLFFRAPHRGVFSDEVLLQNGYNWPGVGRLDLVRHGQRSY
ncbi:hypothetical protein BYT27DRAFT_7266627 [Phlegmacium glaucopus]|nr:hypothetical protein BYT27DRAFT_7266627 [Phlegmacium glaucopus]